MLRPAWRPSPRTGDCRGGGGRSPRLQSLLRGSEASADATHDRNQLIGVVVPTASRSERKHRLPTNPGVSSCRAIVRRTYEHDRSSRRGSGRESTRACARVPRGVFGLRRVDTSGPRRSTRRTSGSRTGAAPASRRPRSQRSSNAAPRSSGPCEDRIPTPRWRTGELGAVDPADAALRRVRGHPGSRLLEDDESAASEAAGADPDAGQRRPGVPASDDPGTRVGLVRGTRHSGSSAATSATWIATGRHCARSSRSSRAGGTGSPRCESSTS